MGNSVDIVNTEISSQCSSDILQRFKSLEAVDGNSVSSTVELIWKANRGCNDFLCENPEWLMEPQGANGCNIYFSILVNGQKETVLMYYLDLSNFRAYAGTDINNLDAASFGIRVSKAGANGYLDLSK